VSAKGSEKVSAMRKREIKQLSLIFLLVFLVKILLIAFILLLIKWNKLVVPSGFNDAPILYATSSKWDAFYFVKVATEGYPSDTISGHYAFEPLFPFLIRVLTFLTANAWISAAIVSNVFYFMTLIAFYFVAKIYLREQQAMHATLLLGFFPLFVTYGFVAYSDVLYMFFAISSFYFFSKGKYFHSGTLGAFGSLTRSVGLLLTPIYFVAIYYLYKKKKVKLKNEMIFLLGPAVALGLLSIYFYSLTGNILALPKAHEIWGTGIGSILDFIASTFTPLMTAVTFSRLLYIAFFFLAAFIVRRINPLLTFYCLVFLILFINLKGIAALSVARYSLAAWPAFLIFGRVKDREIVFLLALLFLILSFQSIYYHMTEFWL